MAQLQYDEICLTNGKPVSLLAKWMPSENATSEPTKRHAHLLANLLGYSPRQYRKKLSALRKYLRVTEVDMSANQWGEIDYARVPSRANLIYKDAFMRHDEDRRAAYLEAVNSGEAKINAGVLFPHDIVARYAGCASRYESTIDGALEALWRALPNTMTGNGNVLVVRDGSGSMGSNIGKTSVRALDVSTALAIYFAERCTGAFKDKYITFSACPEIVSLVGMETLMEKLRESYRYDDCSNTNIEATFDLILSAAVINGMNQADLPRIVLVISDMEFDGAVYGRKAGATLFSNIAARFVRAGYALPKLAFWNVNSRTDTVPMKENENGVVLVSGFSPAVVKMVLSGELDPYMAMMNVLESDRYDMVREAIKEVEFTV
ncbi:MAG: DUF2828 family protein [Alphaproteobacteria bacterium]|nr:DUF2828 family protein [Alphaproteobacteria bacterium]